MAKKNSLIELLKNRIKAHEEALEDKKMFETFDLKKVAKAKSKNDRQALMNAAANMMANKDEYLIHQGAILELNELLKLVEKAWEQHNVQTNVSDGD